MNDSTRGRLLVAAPTLLDGNFYRSVVFVLEHNPDGAIGVVLNRPSELPVSTAIEGWAEQAIEPAVLFLGGLSLRRPSSPWRRSILPVPASVGIRFSAASERSTLSCPPTKFLDWTV